MDKNILKLKKGEELQIINGKGGVTIKNTGNKLLVQEDSNSFGIENIAITDLDFNDLKRYFLFEIYYLEMISEDVPEGIKKKVNELMNYHYRILYGKEYNKKHSGIEKEKFQCITHLKHNSF
ncbi:MAG: hypothetical protein NC483_01125 [Ruminococcus sp.]|nr:hypothetical protein [Ruminococcus sp.]